MADPPATLLARRRSHIVNGLTQKAATSVAMLDHEAVEGRFDLVQS